MNHNKCLFFFVILGLIIRLYAFYEIGSNKIFDNYYPSHDAFYNIRVAQESINDVYPEKVSDYIPYSLDILLLRFVFLLFGENLFVYRLIQIGVAVLAIPFVYFIGRKLVSPFSGIVAAFVWAFSPDLILYDVQILKYSLTFSATIFALYGCIVFSENKTVFNFCMAMGLICLLGHFRSFYFFLIFFIFKPSKLNYKYFLGIISILFLVFLCFLKWAPTKMKTHIGVHMYFGFNRLSNGFYSDIPFVRDNTLGHYQEGVKLGQILSEKYDKFLWINNFWLQKTISFIWEHPVSAFKLALLKFYQVLFYRGWSDTPDVLFQQENFKSLKIAVCKYPFILILSLIGFLFCVFLPKKRNFWFLNVFLLLPLLSVIGTCTASRYQAQLVPIFCLYAAIGVETIYQVFREKIPYKFIFIFILVVLTGRVLIKEYSYSLHQNKFFETKWNEYILTINFNNTGQNKFVPFLNHKIQLSYEEVMEIFYLFYNVYNTTDAVNLIKIKLKEKNSIQDKSKYYELLGLAYAEQEFYEESIFYFSEAQRIFSEIDLKISFKELNALRLSRDSIISYT